MDAVQVVRDAWQAYQAGGVEALARFYHPDGEIVGGPLFGPTGTWTGGPDALRKITAEVDQEYEEFNIRSADVQPGGSDDRVLVESIVEARPGGAWRSWWVITILDEKIRRLEVFHEPSQAFTAAGLGQE